MNGRRPPWLGAGSGFSLIELLVVMAILSLMTTAGVLSYASFRHAAEAQSAARILVGAMASARQSAIADNSRYQVVISRSSGEVWIDELDAAGEVERRMATHPAPLPEPIRIESLEIEGIDMSLADFPAIRFWPDGRSNSAVLRLIRTVDDPAIETNYTTIKLFGPTGVARTYYSERR